jgi:hypothetical protein
LINVVNITLLQMFLAWYSRTLVASTQTKICTILCAIEKKDGAKRTEI